MEEFLKIYPVINIVSDLGYLVMFFVFIIIAKFINNILTPYNINDQLTQKDNNALAVSLSGYFLAITIIYIGSMLGPETDELTKDIVIKDFLLTAKYSLIGIVLLNVARIINDKIILYKFSNVKEIIEDRNVGTGMVQFGSYVASGLVIAGSIHGQVLGEPGIPDVLVTVIFFLLGQITLVLFTFIYNIITAFDVHDEIEKDNVAAGVAFGGTLIAIGIVLMRATAGDFLSWEYNLSRFAFSSVLVCILLPVVRYLFDKLILSNASLNHEISVDKNNGAAYLEVVLAVSVASVMSFIAV